MQWLILLALGAFALKKKKPTLAERAGSKARLQSIEKQSEADRVALAQATKALGRTAAEKRGDE
jgi:hypothetical protein